MYRIARSFQIGLHEFHEGEIVTSLDFFGKLHGLDLAPVADYFEPVEIYFFRRCLPVFEKVDGLTESSFNHTGPGPIKQLNAAMRDLLTANTLNDVPGFDKALEEVERILAQVEKSGKAGKGKKTAPRARKAKETEAKKIKEAVETEKVKKGFGDAMSGRLKK